MAFSVRTITTTTCKRTKRIFALPRAAWFRGGASVEELRDDVLDESQRAGAGVVAEVAEACPFRAPAEFGESIGAMTPAD